MGPHGGAVRASAVALSKAVPVDLQPLQRPLHGPRPPVRHDADRERPPVLRPVVLEQREVVVLVPPLVHLRHHRARGEIEDVITSDDFDTPTTAALVRHSLYAVNARFGTTPTAVDARQEGMFDSIGIEKVGLPA